MFVCTLTILKVLFYATVMGAGLYGSWRSLIESYTSRSRKNCLPKRTLGRRQKEKKHAHLQHYLMAKL